MNEALRGFAESGFGTVKDVVPWVAALFGIVLGALIVRWLAFRLIRALITKAADFSPHPRLASTRSGRMLLDSAGLLAERRRQRIQTFGSTLRSLTSVTITVIAALLVLNLLGVDTTPAWLGAGVIAAAVAFGAQQIVRDFLTGAFLIVEDQYGVGDSVDVGLVSGTVEAVGLRITQLRDDQGVLWYVRNGEIVRVGNRSQGWGNAVVDVPVGRDADLPRVRELLSEVGSALRQEPGWGDDLLADPVVTGPEALAADHVVMRITVRTPPGDHVDVERELRSRVHAALREDALRADEVENSSD